MTKRYSSRREDKPIFHDDRPVYESVCLVVLILILGVCVTMMVLMPLLLFV